MSDASETAICSFMGITLISERFPDVVGLNNIYLEFCNITFHMTWIGKQVIWLPLQVLLAVKEGEI